MSLGYLRLGSYVLRGAGWSIGRRLVGALPLWVLVGVGLVLGLAWLRRRR